MVEVGSILRYETVSGHNEAWIPVRNGDGGVTRLVISGRECEVVSVGTTRLIKVKFDNHPHPIDMIYAPSDFVVVRGPKHYVYEVVDHTDFSSRSIGVWDEPEDALAFMECGDIEKVDMYQTRKAHLSLRFYLMERTVNVPGESRLLHMVRYAMFRGDDGTTSWVMVESKVLEANDEG